MRSSPPDKVKLQLEGIGKTFLTDGKALSVLEDVHFYAAEGEFVSIIGPSGCGKSTLLNIVAGLEEPTMGTVWLGATSAKTRLGVVGYMHQKDLLLPWRTVLENAVLGLEIQRVPHSEALLRAGELIGTFGLQGFEGSYPGALSGGMRQRAAFLRTVLADQPLLLLDEPFGALDALTRSRMQEWLLKVWGLWRKMIILVTHDVEEALLLSDRVYVMTARPGKVKLVLNVSIPWPRSYQVVADDTFIKMKSQLLASLREETAGVDIRSGP
ncbi:MAG: ABC transporter ATP-binding protein [Chloroflexi bacterium]|nr:ABC transporter ATP-binding protein [Chloroflexota bacterium]